MTLTRSLVTIAVATVVCTVAGIGAGMGLGHWCPDYYRAVLRERPGDPLDPVQIGAGFGLNAGVFTGVVVGVLVVAVVAFFELRVRLAQIRRGEFQSWEPNQG
jgi:hypothetical protein